MIVAEVPSKRIEVVKVMNDEQRREERERLDAELEAAGVDVSVLPSIESIAMKLLATRQPIALRATIEDPVTLGGVAWRANDEQR